MRIVKAQEAFNEYKSVWKDYRILSADIKARRMKETQGRRSAKITARQYSSVRQTSEKDKELKQKEQTRRHLLQLLTCCLCLWVSNKKSTEERGTQVLISKMALTLKFTLILYASHHYCNNAVAGHEVEIHVKYSKYNKRGKNML